MGFQRSVQSRVLRNLTTLLVGALFLAPLATFANETGPIERYAKALASANAQLSLTTRGELARRLLLLSSYYRIDPRLLLAIVSAESSWRAGIISPVGAKGDGQLMPATAADLRVEPLEPYENLDGTARSLRRMIVRFASSPPSERFDAGRLGRKARFAHGTNSASRATGTVALVSALPVMTRERR